VTGAARDLQAEQDHAEWHGWMDAQGYDFADDSYQAEAFAAGMQAERDLAAATPAQPAPVSPDLECTACAPVVTPPHGVPATPGQALSPDPADFAYHVRATAFNVLTGKMAGDEWSVPRSERDAIARAVVDAVEPLIRADEREHAAPHAEAGPLREALEATLADWRDDAVYRITDTRDEITEEHAVSGCADTLAGILADHPDTGPQPAPELAADLREAQHAARTHRKRLRMLLGDTPFEFKPDWAPEYEDETGDIRELPGPQPAPELAAAMRESRLRAEVITEILAAFSPSGSGHTARVGMVQVAKWRTRAGLTP
jgi:hypothetical protein